MRKEGPCGLWGEKVKESEKKGFTMDRECPVSEICDGRNCLIVNGPNVKEKILYQAQTNGLPNTTTIGVR